jgi:hypothetical protein
MALRRSFVLVALVLQGVGCSGGDFDTMAAVEDSATDLETGAETESPETGPDARIAADSGASAEDGTDGATESEDSASTEDASEPDAFVPDTFAPDTFAPDTAAGDTFVPDTFVADTNVHDTYVPDVAVDTYVPPPCDVTKTPAEDACVLRDDLGIFVSPSKGSDANAGTKASPVKTLAQAETLAKLGKHRVYACAETFVEQLTLRDGVSLFGGIDCTTWKVSGKSAIAAPISPAIIGKSIANVRIERFDVRSPDATSGQSSIGALFDGATAIVFVDDSIRSGLGGAGSTGASGANGVVGDDGGNGPDAITFVGCGAKPTAGGAPGTNQRSGGKGAGLQCYDFPIVGADAASAGATCGKAGVITATTCSDAPPGCDGGQGTNGIGGASLGVVSALGYSPAAPGGSGGSGSLGSGGGGGGSGQGKMIPSTPSGTTGGGGGGGGGAGGFGSGGSGGTSAGASIAVLSNASDVTFVRTPIATKGGGAGGAGGHAGVGASGGAPGKGGHGKCTTFPCETNDGCAGGKGGRGGDGGAGGGGGGGPSIGVAYHGTAPALDVASTITLGVGGAGGASTGNAGAKGSEKPTLAF